MNSLGGFLRNRFSGGSFPGEGPGGGRLAAAAAAAAAAGL